MNYYPLIWPLLRTLDPERAHTLTLAALRTGLLPPAAPVRDPRLAVRLWGLAFANPLGMAAGFDKNAEVPLPLLRQGFGFVEIGTVTPRPQAGNPRPRLFRLLADRAVINRMGFNNAGLDTVARRLAAPQVRARTGPIGGNIGPNRDAADPAADCVAGMTALAGIVDYLVVNVSSPNTPGLRALQQRESLANLLARLNEARARLPVRPPLLVKVAPDLTAEERAAIAETVLAAGIDGLVATNTTIARPATLRSPAARETGGLSGRPLFATSTAVLADFYRLTGGRLPLIGVGGIASGDDAYAKIRAGASLVQLYTGLVYAGPALIGRINRRLAELLQRDGFASVAAAVGADAGKPAGLADTGGPAGPVSSSGPAGPVSSSGPAGPVSSSGPAGPVSAGTAP